LIQKRPRQPIVGHAATPERADEAAGFRGAAMAPRPNARRSTGMVSATIAMATGTTAPPPTACTERAIESIVRSFDTAEEPPMKAGSRR
jgi:hypothetical protein